jgi:transposase
MATPLLPDALWNLIEPLLPTPTPKPQGGSPRLSDRACLQGVLFVLRSGIPWRMLPQEMNCGSGMSCWRRLRDLARSRHLATDPLRPARLARTLRTDRLVTCSRGWQFRTSGFWGLQTGPNPTDRAKLGSKRHLICDGRGIPLAIQLTGANRNDSQQAFVLVDAIPTLQGVLGRPRHRPDRVLGDRGYDAEAIRQGLRERRIVPLLAKRNTEHGSGLGRWRWVVERTFAWLNQFRRLRVRYEKRADIHEAFLALGCILICWRFLEG